MKKKTKKTTKKKIQKRVKRTVHKKEKIKKVEFITPMYFLIWAIVLIVAYIVSVNFAQDDCLWETTSVDNEGLMNACGMDYEDYILREDINYCPEGEDFIEREKAYCMTVHMGIIYVFLVAGSIIYNLLYIVYYINKKKKSVKYR